MTFVVPGATADASEALGGKARGLAALRRADLPIPAWIVLRPVAFEASLSPADRAALESGAVRDLEVPPAAAVRAELGGGAGGPGPAAADRGQAAGPPPRPGRAGGRPRRGRARGDGPPARPRRRLGAPGGRAGPPRRPRLRPAAGHRVGPGRRPALAAPVAADHRLDGHGRPRRRLEPLGQ